MCSWVVSEYNLPDWYHCHLHFGGVCKQESRMWRDLSRCPCHAIVDSLQKKGRCLDFLSAQIYRMKQKKTQRVGLVFWGFLSTIVVLYSFRNPPWSGPWKKDLGKSSGDFRSPAVSRLFRSERKVVSHPQCSEKKHFERKRALGQWNEFRMYFHLDVSKK